MNRCTYINEVWNSKRSWTYLQVLYESLFSLIHILYMVMERNLEIMLG
jgi:hypothetical protein